MEGQSGLQPPPPLHRFAACRQEHSQYPRQPYAQEHSIPATLMQQVNNHYQQQQHQPLHMGQHQQNQQLQQHHQQRQVIQQQQQAMPQQQRQVIQQQQQAMPQHQQQAMPQHQQQAMAQHQQQTMPQQQQQAMPQQQQQAMPQHPHVIQQHQQHVIQQQQTLPSQQQQTLPAHRQQQDIQQHQQQAIQQQQTLPPQQQQTLPAHRQQQDIQQPQQQQRSLQPQQLQWQQSQAHWPHTQHQPPPLASAPQVVPVLKQSPKPAPFNTQVTISSDNASLIVPTSPPPPLDTEYINTQQDSALIRGEGSGDLLPEWVWAGTENPQTPTELSQHLSNVCDAEKNGIRNQLQNEMGTYSVTNPIEENNTHNQLKISFKREQCGMGIGKGIAVRKRKHSDAECDKKRIKLEEIYNEIKSLKARVDAVGEVINKKLMLLTEFLDNDSFL
uniref:Uncharacterized protein n=1 Tax=Dikerogammarus haemobaphes virus 1 TaxID=2704946 RepID=A0A6G9HER8_9VIRU|nr:hypothetical protein [Dikerogammarus haemobaphes virus 1]